MNETTLWTHPRHIKMQDVGGGSCTEGTTAQLEVGHVQREHLLSVYLILFVCPQEIPYLSTGHIFLLPKSEICLK